MSRGHFQSGVKVYIYMRNHIGGRGWRGGIHKLLILKAVEARPSQQTLGNGLEAPSPRWDSGLLGDRKLMMWVSCAVVVGFQSGIFGGGEIGLEYQATSKAVRTRPSNQHWATNWSRLRRGTLAWR